MVIQRPQNINEMTDMGFLEDGLRILQALRFASTLDFSLEEETSGAIYRNKELLKDIAPEQIRFELDRLLCGNGVERVLREYAEVIAVLIPELAPMFGFPQNNKYHNLDVWEHTIKTVISIPPEPVLRLTMLLHDIGKPECFSEGDDGSSRFRKHPEKGAEKAVAILRRLKYDDAVVDLVHNLVLTHDWEIYPEYENVKKWLEYAGPDVMNDILLVMVADACGKCAESRDEWIEILNNFAECMQEVLKNEENK